MCGLSQVADICHTRLPLPHTRTATTPKLSQWGCATAHNAWIRLGCAHIHRWDGSGASVPIRTHARTHTRTHACTQALTHSHPTSTTSGGAPLLTLRLGCVPHAQMAAAAARERAQPRRHAQTHASTHAHKHAR